MANIFMNNNGRYQLDGEYGTELTCGTAVRLFLPSADVWLDGCIESIGGFYYFISDDNLRIRLNESLEIKLK